jgi:hypothetical protein
VHMKVDGGGGNVDILFSGMTFPDDPETLARKDLWLADSGATPRIKPHDIGMVNMVAQSASAIVIMGNRTQEYK